MNFTRLQTFVAVVDAGSISQAGKLLGMSQPAVSQHIKTLESEFGVQLFRRTPDGVEITSIGAIAYDHVRKILDEYAGLLADIQTTQAHRTGRLRIGACSVPGAYILPEIIFRFRNANPEVEIIMHAGSSESILEWVRNGRIDVGAVDLRAEDDQFLVYTPFYRDPLVLITPTSHPWSGATQVLPSDLTSQPFISRQEDSGTRRTIEAGMQQWQLGYDQLNVVTELDSTEAVIREVEQGRGVSLVSRHAALPALEMGRIRTVAIAAEPAIRQFLLVMRRCTAASPLVNAFKAMCGYPAGEPSAAATLDDGG